ncbi:MAG: RNA-binding S4 domain-containing protein [Hyphomicrobiaceae bacterium]
MTPDENEGDAAQGGGELRLDKWLWYARVVKSRTLAAGLVEEGKVRLNRERTTKPSQIVRIGDVLTIAVGPRVRVLEVTAIGTRRGPAREAQALYVDRTPPTTAANPAPPAAGERPSGGGRPTKRDRRQIDRLTEPD